MKTEKLHTLLNGLMAASLDKRQVTIPVDVARELSQKLERLVHAQAALRSIARTCIECPETASFACAAADDPLTAFAPIEDYLGHDPKEAGELRFAGLPGFCYRDVP